jgi:uncharacterized membrane protein YfcA
MDWTVTAGLVAAAAMMEFIDSGLGMGYGTVLTPLLMAFGYGPLEVVPAILLSQAVGGFTAAVFHHKQGNVNFMPKKTSPREIANGYKERGIVGWLRRTLSDDMKTVFGIVVLGGVAAVIGSVLAVHVPAWFFKVYVGAMVTGIGILLLWGKTFQFSWKKLMAVGFFASFNKGFSGGGFGPIATGGQLVVNKEQRSSVGCTTLAEAPICIIGFVTYALQKSVGAYWLLAALIIGAAIGAVFGPVLTKKLNQKAMKVIVGVLILVLGIRVLLNLVGVGV